MLCTQSGHGGQAPARMAAFDSASAHKRTWAASAVTSCRSPDETRGKKVTDARKGMVVWGKIAPGIVICTANKCGDQISAAALSLKFSASEKPKPARTRVVGETLF